MPRKVLASVNGHQSHGASVRKKARVEDAVDEEEKAGEDYLSRLPEDCLIKIFGRLTRRELLRAKLLNRRLGTVATNGRLYKGRSTPGCLSITQVSNGYTFMLSTKDLDDERKNKVKTFEYVFQHSTVNTQRDRENGVQTRKEKMEYSTTRTVNTQRYRENWVQTRKEMIVKVSRRKQSMHDLPVPPRFCEEMSSMLIQYSATNIFLSRVRLDADFIATIISSLRRCTMQKMFIEHATIDENAVDANDELNTFLVESKMSVLALRGCPALLEKGFLDENWFMRMNGSALVNVRSRETWQDHYKYRFHPSKSILPVISAYETLIMPSMILNGDWIGELIMALHNNRQIEKNKDNYWTVGIDRRIGAHEIKEQFTNAEFECTVLWDKNYVIQVAKKNSAVKARFEIVPTLIDADNGTIMYLLDIAFTSNDSPWFLAHYRQCLMRKGLRPWGGWSFRDGIWVKIKEYESDPTSQKYSTKMLVMPINDFAFPITYFKCF